MNVEEIWTIFKTTLLHTLRKTCGKKKERGPKNDIVKGIVAEKNFMKHGSSQI